MSDLVEDLVDKVDVVSCREQNAVHHVVNGAVLLFNATQTGVAASTVGQSAAVRVVFLLLSRTIGLRLATFLLTAIACSYSLA